MSYLSKVYLPIGKRVIVFGGDLKGLEATLFLVKRGREVYLLEEGETLGEGMNEHLKSKFFPWMEAHERITSYTGVTCNEVTPEGMVVTTREGEQTTIKADTVMIIEKVKKNHDLYDAIKGTVPEVYIIGDAREDRSVWIHGAVHDGARVGFSV
jgi:2,4-dienoyl-CoA reductase (NADPH2)